MKKLEPRQRRFVQEYMKDLNATQAAIRAGYSKKTARTQAANLLARVNIQAAVARAQKKREKKTEITVDRIERELGIIGFSNLQDYVEINDDTGAIRAKGFGEMPPDSSRALESIEENRAIKENADGSSTTVYDKIKFKLHDKLRALELLGRRRGMFPNKIEGNVILDGGVVLNIITAVPRPEEAGKKK